MSSSLKGRYAEFMGRQGRKISTHADVIVDAVGSIPGTFSADEIAANVKGKVSRATVFRTLRWLMTADLVRQVRFNGCDVFVLTAD